MEAALTATAAASLVPKAELARRALFSYLKRVGPDPGLLESAKNVRRMRHTIRGLKDEAKSRDSKLSHLEDLVEQLEAKNAELSRELEAARSQDDAKVRDKVLKEQLESLTKKQRGEYEEAVRIYKRAPPLQSRLKEVADFEARNVRPPYEMPLALITLRRVHGSYRAAAEALSVVDHPPDPPPREAPQATVGGPP